MMAPNTRPVRNRAIRIDNVAITTSSCPSDIRTAIVLGRAASVGTDRVRWCCSAPSDRVRARKPKSREPNIRTMFFFFFWCEHASAVGRGLLRDCHPIRYRRRTMSPRVRSPSRGKEPTDLQIARGLGTRPISRTPRSVQRPQSSRYWAALPCASIPWRARASYSPTTGT